MTNQSNLLLLKQEILDIVPIHNNKYTTMIENNVKSFLRIQKENNKLGIIQQLIINEKSNVFASKFNCILKENGDLDFRAGFSFINDFQVIWHPNKLKFEFFYNGQIVGGGKLENKNQSILYPIKSKVLNFFPILDEVTNNEILLPFEISTLIYGIPLDNNIKTWEQWITSNPNFYVFQIDIIKDKIILESPSKKIYNIYIDDQIFINKNEAYILNNEEYASIVYPNILYSLYTCSQYQLTDNISLF